MNEDEAHDLLIRLETKIGVLCNEMADVKSELRKRQCLLHESKIASFEKSFDPSKCSTNTEKIKTIEKLTWAALLTGITLVGKSLWSAVTT